MKAISKLVVVSAVVVGAVGGAVGSTTNVYTVAAGETKTFTQMEADLGVSFVEGDAIVKKGPGILVADSSHLFRYDITVEEGVFEVPNIGKNPKQSGTIRVKKGACWHLHNGDVAFNTWTYYIEGEGTGVEPYLGAVSVCATAGNGQTNYGTWNLTDDATIYTGKTSSGGNVYNYIFSGASNTSGPTVNMNYHTLTIKGVNTDAMFRPRWRLTINKAGPIIGDNIFCARHANSGSVMDTYNLPLFKLVNGAILSVDGYFYKKIGVFDFEFGTSLGKTGAGGGTATSTLNKIIGCPTITSDATITCGSEFQVRGGDFAEGKYLTAANTFTFNGGCVLTANGLGAVSMEAGKTYTIATSSASITGTPTPTGAAARCFDVINTGKSLDLKVKDNLLNAVKDGGLLPGEENAESNTAALPAFAAMIKDGAVVFFPEGDYYFADTLDLSSVTAKDVAFLGFDCTAAIHASLKLGAMENVAIETLTFKECAGPAVVAADTLGLRVSNCVLDGVIGAYEDGKKYPFAVSNVTDFEVAEPTYKFTDYQWDGTAYFNGGSQTEASLVRAGEWIVRILSTDSDGGDLGWIGGTYATNQTGLAKSAYRGLKLCKRGVGAFDPNQSLAEIGITGVDIQEGQFVTRGDSHLGVAKSKVVVHDGAALTIAGAGAAVDSRTVEICGTGLNSTTPAVRFTGTSAWNKASTVTWYLTGDATMYDNVNNGGDGTFLWGIVKMNGHTLTLTGYTYRFGRSFNWYGGGTLIVNGASVTASPVDDNSTVPLTNYAIKDGLTPKVIVRNKGKLMPDTCELLNIMRDVDFATPDCTLSAKKGMKIPHDFKFDRLAGVPQVNDIILSVSVASNYTAHVADIAQSKAIEMKGRFNFDAGATFALDDPTAMTPSPDSQILLITAQGGINRRPKLDAATRAAGWHVVRNGNSLYLRDTPGEVIILR